MGLVDLLLPQRCLLCSGAPDLVCAPCLARVPRIVPPVCARCGAPGVWPVARCAECAGRRLAFTSARAAVRYDDDVSTIVSAWKERGLRRLAELAADLIAERVARPSAATLTYVAPDSDRSLRRGHHPAERLAVELAQRWELPSARLLARSGTRRRQRGLPLAERRLNVRGAFRPIGEVPRRVTLVDDVYTSGATANAAASALRKGGARHVGVVTFARAVR